MALLDPQDRLVLKDPVGFPFRDLRVLLGRREREERSALPVQWEFLEVLALLVEMVPQEQGVCQVITDHRDNKDPLGQLEPRERQELRDRVDQQGCQGIEEFPVLLVPKAIKEKEVMCSPRPLCELLHAKCVNSLSRATCHAITPS